MAPSPRKWQEGEIQEPKPSWEQTARILLPSPAQCLNPGPLALGGLSPLLGPQPRIQVEDRAMAGPFGCLQSEGRGKSCFSTCLGELSFCCSPGDGWMQIEKKSLSTNSFILLRCVYERWVTVGRPQFWAHCLAWDAQPGDSR